jgi:hypothetical protein
VDDYVADHIGLCAQARNRRAKQGVAVNRWSTRPRGLSVATVLGVMLAGLVALGGTASAAVPGNDDLANAASMSGSSDCVTGDNTDATGEAGEVAHHGDSNSVWWTWTATDTGTTTVRVFLRSLPDSTLAVSTGTSFPVSELGENDDTYSVASEVTFSAQTGTVYNFRVAGYGNYEGTFALSLNGGCPPPANDDFADAAAMSGDSGSLLDQTNEAATVEPDEPAATVSTSVWYHWTPTSAGSAGVCVDTTAAGDLGGRLAIFTGSWGALTVVGTANLDWNSDCSSPFNRIALEVEADTTYFIAVGGQYGNTGPFDLFWGDVIPPSASIAVGSAQATPTNASPVTFDVTFDEPVTGFADADVDLSSSTATTGTVSVSDTGDHMHFTVDVAVSSDGTVEAFIPADSATDAADNGNSSSTSASVTYDATNPTMGAITTRVQGAKVTVRFSASDALTSVFFMCSVDSGADDVCSSPFIFNSTAGSHTFHLTAIDGADNSVSDSAGYTVKSKRIK